jgi:hypothetical protein
MNNNICRIFLLIGVLACLPQRVLSQGAFVNLDFENPITPLQPMNFQVPTADGIPGWTAYVYGNQTGEIYYNDIALDAAAVSLQGPGSFEPVLQGSYSVFLQGTSTSTSPSGSAAIGQTGQIPIGTKSILFLEQVLDSFQLTFAGQSIALNEVGSTANYDIVAGDVSMFAGETGQLVFTASPGHSGELDSIQFSSSPVPEPSTIALGILGALSFAICHRRKIP